MQEAFEFCLTCFALRLPSSGEWVGEDPGRHQLVASKEPTYFYRWRAGSYGFPGDYTRSLIGRANKNEGQSYGCLSASAIPYRELQQS